MVVLPRSFRRNKFFLEQFPAQIEMWPPVLHRVGIGPQINRMKLIPLDLRFLPSSSTFEKRLILGTGGSHWCRSFSSSSLNMKLFVVLLLNVFVLIVSAHSRLEYPPAGGSYCGNLDFQDPDTCMDPCGGNWGSSETTLQRGQDIEYKWDRNK